MSTTITLTQGLRHEYAELFRTCVIRPARVAAVESLVARVLASRARYEQVARASGVPWHVIAAIHAMESSLRFTGHLHNGDPLTARTVQVPAGRPRVGSPPFTWEESAADALSSHRLGHGTEWSLAGTLYQLERYNGWGYRRNHPEVRSPYLWSFSQHYSSGKYVADGRFSPTATSGQCGAAVLLRRLAEHGHIDFADQPRPAPDTDPLLVRYSTSRPADANDAARAEQLQRWLNTFAGIFVRVDGIPGPRTSAAYRLVTGAYLPGDPRHGVRS
ncbi:MAG: hypothetical protein KJ066_14335 [Acidobacteria bacterium]|nr:hypothetical protein [Acidobacteriota bacterium]